jgi:hypothetical protein
LQKLEELNKKDNNLTSKKIFTEFIKTVRKQPKQNIDEINLTVNDQDGKNIVDNCKIFLKPNL